jgi:hypothetical protein
LAESVTPTTDVDDVVDRLGTPRRPSNIPLRIAVAAAVVLVVVATIAIVQRDDDQAVVDSGPAPTIREPLPEWHPRGLSPGWHDLPTGPVPSGFPVEAVWTGSELVVHQWYGVPRGPASAVPAAFDPRDGRWTELPGFDASGDRPLVSGSAWTGTEALFWAHDRIDAWNPSTRTWRTTTTPSRLQRNGVWTGAEVVFWADGVAYDPAADSWREIARPSEFLIATVGQDTGGLRWTGKEVVVVGGLSGAYDVASNTWREFGAPLAEESGSPGVGFDGLTATVTEIDGRIVAFDFSPDSAAVLDLDAGIWTEAPELTPPIDPAGWLQIVAFDDGRVLFVGTNDVQLRNLDGSFTSFPVPAAGQVVGTGDAVFQYGERLGSGVVFSLFVPPPVATASPAGAWDASILGPGWHVLDRGPLPPGAPYVLEASPSHLFVYGFDTPEDVPLGRAFTYELATGTWSELPASPLTSAQALGGAWTGEEFVVWSTSGVAFWNASGQRWRAATAPPRPLDAHPYWGGDGGWTGRYTVFWANRLKYDVTSDEWEEIPVAPVVPSRTASAFDGDELIVVGLADEDVPYATAEMAFDPLTNAWRLLPPSGLNGQELDLATLVDTNGRRTILGVDYENNAAIYDGETDTWRAIDPLPLDTGEDSRTVVALDDGRAFVTSTWTGQALMDADERWTPVTGGPGGFVATAITGGVALLGEEFAVYVP